MLRCALTGAGRVVTPRGRGSTETGPVVGVHRGDSDFGVPGESRVRGSSVPRRRRTRQSQRRWGSRYQSRVAPNLPTPPFSGSHHLDPAGVPVSVSHRTSRKSLWARTEVRGPCRPWDTLNPPGPKQEGTRGGTEGSGRHKRNGTRGPSGDRCVPEPRPPTTHCRCREWTKGWAEDAPRLPGLRTTTDVLYFGPSLIVVRIGPAGGQGRDTICGFGSKSFCFNGNRAQGGGTRPDVSAQTPRTRKPLPDRVASRESRSLETRVRNPIRTPSEWKFRNKSKSGVSDPGPWTPSGGVGGRGGHATPGVSRLGPSV